MPNLDGGHYFFTAIVPIKNDVIVEHEGLRSSPVHMVREALETLPTALQSPEAVTVGIQSPFARSLRTHFARLVMLDQPFFNGRDHSDAVADALHGTDLLAAQPNDVLACPYLLVMIDFDPQAGANEPRRYCEELWTLMPRELEAVFRFCYGFSAVRDARSFADFLLPCQVETTMPFNDYWIGPPQLPSLSRALLVALPLIGVALPVIAALLHRVSWPTGLVLALVLGLAGLAVDVGIVMLHGARPLPAAPDASLRHVLKALYLQQAFTRFAIDHQGAAPQALGAAFRQFLATHRPRDLEGPTQNPGVIGS
ncbi:hypothetical protein [Methylobacterium nonmethylotrophicum]|uniref:Uncharacterized protein n=1 Tax=Methylobacterium nonmethylotrophicum TaxID=1141884 RepID=A0A4Z0NUL0_9HYPH|nr:hypothetical protein [Methylobacterium nonmethylotrophicum]TGE01224.1 hypothetical protein EU555_06390 [Methylobacterium nonmethylotrophicum]